jgi:hypothetical protein
LLRLSCGLAAFEQAIREHEDGNKRQQENCVLTSLPPKSGGDCVPGRLEHNPANRGYDHANEYDCCGVVSNNVIEVSQGPGEAWHREATRGTNHQQRESAPSKNNETYKDEDVQ